MPERVSRGSVSARDYGSRDVLGHGGAECHGLRGAARAHRWGQGQVVVPAGGPSAVLRATAARGPRQRGHHGCGTAAGPRCVTALRHRPDQSALTCCDVTPLLSTDLSSHCLSRTLAMTSFLLILNIYECFVHRQRSSIKTSA